jgi:hypothetical protein
MHPAFHVVQDVVRDWAQASEGLEVQSGLNEEHQ